MKTRSSVFCFLLFFCLNSFYAIGNSETNHKKGKKELANLTGIEDWMEAQVLNGNTLVSYFTISQGEFLEYINTNNISKISIDYFSEEKNGSEIQLLNTIVLEDFGAGFNVETWAGEVENVDTVLNNYLAQVTLNDDFCGPKISISLIQEQIEEEEEDLPIELPEFECGDQYEPEDISNQTPLSSAVAGELFFISGFPILLQTVNGSNGSFSGTGIVPLPFDKKVVSVEFENISVNSQYQVYQGVVNTISGDPSSYPDFDVEYEPYNIGGDICLPEPPPPGYNSEGVNQATGLDDWGFDPNTGLNNETGSQYDQNGFDIYGNHIETGSPYNDQGCNREGYTEDGQPCDPTGGPNPEAEAFAESLTPTLGTDITNIISGLNTELQDSLLGLDCSSIRTEMEGLINTLGFNRSFIFGENDIYFSKNMHLQFQEKPKPMVLNIERNEDAKTLEEKHIDLFECDKTEFALEAFITALAEMSNDQGLLDIILAKIGNWTQYEFNIYSTDTEKFNEWLIRTIGGIMLENSELDESYTQNELDQHSIDSKIKSSPNFSYPQPLYNSIASSNNLGFLENEFTLDDASFYFRQGDQKINGIDRVFYLEELAKKRRFNTTNGSENLLPIKVDKTVGNKTYSIYLDNISFSPNGASLDAYAIIDDPESGRRLSFKALNISFGPTGLNEESKLHLDSDLEIRLNNSAMLILKGTEKTFVSWDCNGFAGMGVDAEIEFCRNYIIPLDPVSLNPLPDSVRYRLAVSIQDLSAWLEFYIIVDAPPFALANYEDVKWELTNMILDFSSNETPEFSPLDGYASPFFDGTTMSPAWKGFYLEQLKATLPNDFSEGSEPITADAFDILIDGSGFTGGVKVENLLTIGDGNLGGWPFSIDEFEIRVIQNQFTGGGLGGQINVPIFEENMDYEAVIYPGSEYSFTVAPSTDVTVNMFLATAEINSNSEILIGKVDGEFLALASLNGKLEVNTENGSSGLNINLPSMTFEGFEVSNQAPYFSPGNWGLVDASGAGAGINFNGFGIRIDSLKPYSPGEGKAGLGLNLDIKLIDALEINAGGRIGIEGELVEENGRQRWEFDRIDIGSLFLDASFPGADVQGVVEWYGSEDNPDPEWGKGFRGVISTKFKGFNLALDAAAQFGKKDNYKYFFVDALADLGNGIGTGAIQLKGFGGGISYRMDVDPTNVQLVNQSGNFNLPPIGTSFSGTNYTPNPDAGLGLKASVIISSLKEEVFNGTVSMYFNFHNNNSLEEIILQGSGQFLTPIDLGIVPELPGIVPSAPSSVDAALSAYIELTMNFSEPSFHGDLEVYLNSPTINGAGDGGKLVDAEIHFDPTQWYIYIGRPEEGQRCGIIFTVPGISGGVSATGYFDVGTNVPPMADLPTKVKSIAYKISDNQSLRSSGAGFVVGASLGFKMSANIAGIISTTLEAEAGYDFMLRKYQGLTCQGSSDPVGINGWYASGQMWAYVYGELKVFGVNIVSAGLAAVIQARLPNPFWAQATVGVRVKLLFVTVNKSLKLKLGDDCILVSNDPQDALGIEIITFLEPFEGVTDLETSSQPEAHFALELGRVYNISDLQGVEQNYKVELKSTSLISGNGLGIGHDVEYINDNASLRIIPFEMIPSNDSITFEVTVNVFKNGTFLTEETKSTYFFTGETQDYIPVTNVSSSYPANGMVNFYKEEYNEQKGFINLNVGQTDLLLLNIPQEKEQVIVFTPSSGEPFQVDYEYDAVKKEISFPMPPEQFENGTIYKLQLLRKDFSGSSTSSSNSSILGLALSNNGNSLPPSTSDQSGSNTDFETNEKVLFELFFRVSDYNSFSNKIATITNGDNSDFKQTLFYDIIDNESFDALEVQGDDNSDPLITMKYNMGSPWLNNTVKPSYEEIDVNTCAFNTYVRGYSDLVATENIMELGGSFKDLRINENTFNQGTINYGSSVLRFALWIKAKTIFTERKNHSLSCITTSPPNTIGLCFSDVGPNDPGYIEDEDECLQQLQNDMNNLTFPNLDSGNYPVNVKYRLPNGLTTTNTTINFVKF